MENAGQKEYTLKQPIVLRLLVLYTLRSETTSRIASFGIQHRVYSCIYRTPRDGDIHN